MNIFKRAPKKVTYHEMLDTKIADETGHIDTILSHLSWEKLENERHAKYLADYLIKNYPYFGDGYSVMAAMLESQRNPDNYNEILAYHEKAINSEYDDIMTPIYYTSYLSFILANCLNEKDMTIEYEKAIKKYKHFYDALGPQAINDIKMAKFIGDAKRLRQGLNSGKS